MCSPRLANRRVRGGLAVATMQNVVRILEGRPVLDPNSPDDKFGNIIHGALSSMIAGLGYHLHGINYIPFYKDGATPESVNPLIENNIPKLSSSTAPVSRHRRRDESNTDEPCKRTQDTLISLEYRAIISRGKMGEEETLHQELIKRTNTKIIFIASTTS